MGLRTSQSWALFHEANLNFTLAISLQLLAQSHMRCHDNVMISETELSAVRGRFERTKTHFVQLKGLTQL